jgi:hypothetical protein
LRVSTRFFGAWTVAGVRGARGVFAFFATRDRVLTGAPSRPEALTR